MICGFGPLGYELALEAIAPLSHRVRRDGWENVENQVSARVSTGRSFESGGTPSLSEIEIGAVRGFRSSRPAEIDPGRGVGSAQHATGAAPGRDPSRNRQIADGRHRLSGTGPGAQAFVEVGRR